MKGITMTQYKYDEIKSHFEDWIKEQNKEWITDNIDDLHHHCFNSDYYIIGTYEAKKWLGDEVLYIAEFIKDYEMDNFGELYTDLTNAEAIVNMYVYIIGEQIVAEFENMSFIEQYQTI